MAATDSLSIEDQRKAEEALYGRTDAWLSEQFKQEEANKQASPQTDNITKPHHYNVGGIEPAEFMESLGIAEDYYAGNIIKYASRYRHKNGVEDIRKARQYCTMLIELLESNNEH